MSDFFIAEVLDAEVLDTHESTGAEVLDAEVLDTHKSTGGNAGSLVGVQNSSIQN